MKILLYKHTHSPRSTRHPLVMSDNLCSLKKLIKDVYLKHCFLIVVCQSVSTLLEIN